MDVSRKPKQAEFEQRLAALSSAIASKRDEAVQARKDSGIEKVWMECEESYLGIDETNRHEFSGAKWAKPTSMEGPVTSGRAGHNSDMRSTAYVRLTSRYVDAASAKLAEITLPIDDKAFSFEPTPVPDLVKGKEDLTKMVDASAQAVAPNNVVAMPGVPPHDPAPQKILDQIEIALDKAEDASKKAERRVYDWMVESAYPKHMRKVIHDSARIGVGVLKGPYPDKSKSQAISRENDMVALQIVETVVPSVSCLDPWNLFPDPGCGDDIHEGDYILERDYFSSKKLRELKGRKGWMAGQIDKVLEEGPGKVFVNGGSRDEKRNKHRYEVWYYYGVIERDDIEAANIQVGEDCTEVYAIVTLVNDTIVRAIINPMDSGRFPYHVMPWSRRSEHWAGVGVGEQVAMPQRMVNAATRAMLNNAGKSAGAQIILDQGCIVPADGNWMLTPDKIWLKSADAIIDDVRKAFNIVTFPNLQPQLMNVIMYAFKLAEDSSAIPLITQGQTGDTSPQTFGQAELQNTNAHTLLRSIGNSLDDHITEPLVQMLYEWLLIDPDVPDDEKGDFKINAHGSIAMVERAIQETTLMQMMGMAANPAFGADPKKVFAMMLKSKRLDPRDVQYSEEDLAKLAQAQQTPPPMPQVEVAKIRAQAEIQKTQASIQADMQIAQMDNETAQVRIKTDTDRDTVYSEAETQRSNTSAQLRIEELKLKKELAMMDYASKHNISLEQIKAKLASDAMKLRTQKELSMTSMELEAQQHGNELQADLHKHHNPQVMTPPVEVSGRAPDGQAFQR